MTASTRTRNPLRKKALAYGSSGRVHIWWVVSPAPGQPATVVRAIVYAAPGDHTGYSVDVEISLDDGAWQCTCSPGENSCAHRFAIQRATGWEHLGGRWAP